MTDEEARNFRVSTCAAEFSMAFTRLRQEGYKADEVLLGAGRMLSHAFASFPCKDKREEALDYYFAQVLSDIQYFDGLPPLEQVISVVLSLAHTTRKDEKVH